MQKRALDQQQRRGGAATRAIAPAADFSTSVSSSALEAIVAPVTLAPRARDAHFANWAHTFVSDAAAPQRPRIIAPRSVEQVIAAVELARRGDGTHPFPLRAVGRLHSPSDLPFSLGWTLRTDELAGIVHIDARALEATVLAGTYVSTLSEALAAHRPPLGLRNLGSISAQALAGIVSTATHGTGAAFPVLSAYVTALHLVCPLEHGTQLVRCSRTERPELFNATLCGLGATGVIVLVTIAVDHAFALREVAEDVAADTVLGARPSAADVENVVADCTPAGVQSATTFSTSAAEGRAPRTVSAATSSATSRSANAWSTAIVTSTITPVAPSPHRVALNSSGRSVREHRTSCVPCSSGHTRCSAVTYAESTGNAAPVPCVAVDTMPASACAEIEPRLRRPSGGRCAASASESVDTYVPASTVASSARASICTMPASSSVRSVHPSENGRSLGECSRPTARSGKGCVPSPRRASSTAAITCSTLRGAIMRGRCGAAASLTNV